MACRTGCATQDHASWGECARSARLQVGWSRSAAGLDRSADKLNDAECARYHQARVGGIQPDGTTDKKIEFAQRASEKHGARYGTDFHLVPRADRRGYDPVFKKDIDAATASVMTGDLQSIMDAAKKIPGSGVH